MIIFSDVIFIYQLMNSGNLILKCIFMDTPYLNNTLIVLQQHDLAKSTIDRHLDFR